MDPRIAEGLVELSDLLRDQKLSQFDRIGLALMRVAELIQLMPDPAEDTSDLPAFLRRQAD